MKPAIPLAVVKSIIYSCVFLLPFYFSGFTTAQTIIPANDGTGTVVNTNGARIDISGGTKSGDGANLFHSFTEFGINSNQTANFVSQPSIQNILGRVTGGNISVINGILSVTGANSNLFLINPSGIIFGANASLNVPASFTATTANGVGFGSNIFSATGLNNYSTLIGTPNSFIFNTNSVSALLNQANLTVQPGNNLNLFAGTVVSTGNLSAPGGNVIVASVPGTSLLRLSIPGNILSLEIQPPSGTANTGVNDLPGLLTGGDVNVPELVTVGGRIRLVNTGLDVANGDVVVQKLTAGNATLSANNNLTLSESKLLTTGDMNFLAGNTVRVRDSFPNRFSANAGGNISIRGNKAISIFASQYLQEQQFISGGDLTLISDGSIDFNARFNGGKFSVLNSQGQVANLNSSSGTEITAKGDVIFGRYMGDILKVKSGGSITAGDIKIVNDDPDFTCQNRNCVNDENFTTLTLRAGVNNSQSAPANITVGNIDASSSLYYDGRQPGRVIIESTNGNVTTGAINNSLIGNSDDNRGGSVSITAGQSITTGTIDTSVTLYSFPSSIGGKITLETLRPGGNITFDSINTATFYQEGTNEFSSSFGGDVDIKANGVVRGVGFFRGSNDTIFTSTGGSQGNAGKVTIQHDGGPSNVPFIVGNATQNGTAGAITAGTSQISSTSSINTFPVLPNGGTAAGTPNNISIISINTSPSLASGTQLPPTQPNQSVTFRFGDLNQVVIDINQDNTTITLDTIVAGTLTLQNGTPVTPGTILTPNTVLVYTPPTGASGQINTFTIRANDGVSVSAPQSISIKIAQAPPLPQPEPQPEPQPTPQPTTQPTTPVVIPEKKLPENIPNFEKNTPNQYKENTQPNLAPPNIELDTKVAGLDEHFTNQFSTYLDVPKPKVASLDEARDILQKVEDSTGVKPALIYVSFTPSSLSIANTKSQQIISSDNDCLDLVIVTAKGKPIRKSLCEATRAQVLEAARIFKRDVTDFESGDSYQDSGIQLYDWLIKPVENDLKARGINNLVFIMDTGLRSLPVAALYDGKQFLVERYSVGLMPSLSLSDTRYMDIRNAQVLGMGASQFSNQKPLPAVPSELNVITKQVWQGKSFLNEAFTLNNLKAQRQQRPFGIIHLATHGEFKPGAASQSYIQLWDTQLRMNQLRQLGWSNPVVELVVLSACRTALGDEQAELGFAGFAVQAGAKTALASLWYVSDEGTFAMMADFYEQLKKAPIKAEALRQTQIAMLKGQVRLENGKLLAPNGNVDLPSALLELGDKDLRHPYFWSAFTMIGNPW